MAIRKSNSFEILARRFRRQAVLVVVALCALPTLTTAEQSPVASSPRFIDPSSVKAWLDHGQPVVFLDVREADEFTAAHLLGAINVVYDQVATLAESLPHDRPIVVYCIHSTHRAPEAAKTLTQLGFANAYVLEGGITAWHAGGLTIHSSDLTKQPQILPYTNRCKDKPPREG